MVQPLLPQTDLGEKTRRAVLKAAGAALGLGLAGSASGHPGDGGNSKFYGGTVGYLGDNQADSSANMDLVGYHSAGGVGPASLSGRPEDAHRGAMSEFRIHDDLAFVTIFSARDEHSQRGVAILDISDFTRAESSDDLESAELTLLSFVRNENNQSTCMDVKVSDDGEYVFVCKQAITALFGEARGYEPSGDGHSNSVGGGALIAVDVSDPGNPEVTDEVALSHWSVGPHNGWYHQIGGTEYFFTVHGTTGAASVVNTFEFDRSTGQLRQVNAWSWDPNLATGEYGAESNQWYHHDINVQKDPRTGVPLAYLHCWDAGLRIFDVSNPTDPREIGVFEQEGAHHAVPAPTLVDGKRVAVTGHENPDSHYHDYIGEEGGGETGRYHLVDCDRLDAALDPDSDVERVYLGCASTVRESGAGPLERPPYRTYDTDDDAVLVLEDAEELDSWALIEEGEGWNDAWGFEAEVDSEEAGEYDGFSDFRISTHNVDMDTEGRLYAGHYHTGARVFEVGTDADLPPGFDRRSDDTETRSGHGDAEWSVDPVAYFREGQEIPEDRAMAFDTPEGSPLSIDGLTASTPFVWNAVERNGVVFAGGINGGPHAMYVHGEDTDDTDAHEVGNDVPLDVDVERDHDTSLFVSDGTLRVHIRVDSDEDVVVRDAVQTDWDVDEDQESVTDVHEVDGYRKLVTLELDDGETTYYAQTAGGPASYTLAPVEYARADEDGDPTVDSEFGGGNSTTNRLWRKANGAVETVGVLGAPF